MNPQILIWFTAGSAVISAALVALRPDNKALPFHLEPGARFVLATLLGGVQALLMAAQQGIDWKAALPTAIASVLVSLIHGAPRDSDKTEGGKDGV